MSTYTKKIPILLVSLEPAQSRKLISALDLSLYEIVEVNSPSDIDHFLMEKEFAVALLNYQHLDVYETKKFTDTPVVFLVDSEVTGNEVLEKFEYGTVDYLVVPVVPHVFRAKMGIFVKLFCAIHETLKSSEQERESFLDSALDAVVGMSQDGLITLWNRQATAIFGWTKEEVVGKRMSDLIIPFRYRKAHENGLAKFLATGEGPILRKRIEIFALNKEFQEFPIELTVTPLRHGRELSFTAFVRDISEIKFVEAEKKVEQEKLKKALQARDEFIGICSHELKTPITAMKLQFQLAVKQLANNDPKVFTREAVTKRTTTSLMQLDRMTRLIDDMLDVSKISAGSLVMKNENVDFTKLVKDLLDRFTEQLNAAGITLKMKVTNSPLFVYGDKFRLEQVVNNLLTNAIKYGKGSPIEVELTKAGNRIAFRVSDQGIGIKKEYLERIFHRYERAIAASNISGLGLGLYITEQIVKAHNGSITVASEFGRGSTFSIGLPLLNIEREIQVR